MLKGQRLTVRWCGGERRTLPHLDTSPEPRGELGHLDNPSDGLRTLTAPQLCRATGQVVSCACIADEPWVYRVRLLWVQIHRLQQRKLHWERARGDLHRIKLSAGLQFRSRGGSLNHGQQVSLKVKGQEAKFSGRTWTQDSEGKTRRLTGEPQPRGHPGHHPTVHCVWSQASHSAFATPVSPSEMMGKIGLWRLWEVTTRLCAGEANPTPATGRQRPAPQQGHCYLSPEPGKST